MAGPMTKPPIVATIVATALGAGFAPRAPGTFGTLVAVPLAWGLGLLPGWAFFAGLAIVTWVGTWAAGAFCAGSGTHDDQRVVIDEVAGYLLTLALVPKTAPYLASAFLLFRCFDILKPWPIRWVDRTVKGGFGVMADDLAAGVAAALVLAALDHSGVIARLSAWGAW